MLVDYHRVEPFLESLLLDFAARTGLALDAQIAQIVDGA
jgi:hypothetical protein